MAGHGGTAGRSSSVVVALGVAGRAAKMGRKPILGPSQSQLVGKPASLRYRADLVGLDARQKARQLKAEKAAARLLAHMERLFLSESPKRNFVLRLDFGLGRHSPASIA